MGITGVGTTGGYDPGAASSSWVDDLAALPHHIGTAIVDGASFELGASGSHVGALAAMLADLSYFAGPETNTMTPALQSALEAFQRDQGLAVTGRPDRATVESLAAAYTGLRDTPAAKRFDKWRRFDENTVEAYRGVGPDHARSATENLAQALRDVKTGARFVANGFYGLVGSRDVLGGRNNGLLERLANPVVGVAMFGAMMLSAGKNALIDAPVHGIATLLSKD